MVRKRRSIWNWVGATVVILWLTLLAVWIRRVEFTRPVEDGDALPSARAISDHQREWLEVYLKGQKVGYAVSQITPLKGDYLIQEEMFLSLNLLGHVNIVQTLSRALVDKDFVLKSFRFRMDSGVVSYRLEGTVVGDRIELEMGEGRKKRRETLQLSGRPMIPAGVSHFFKGRDLAVGQSFRFPLFDPSAMASREMLVTVKAKESLRIGRMSYEAFRLEARAWGHLLSIWVDGSGSVLKETGFMGMTLVKSSPANAPLGIMGAEGRDLYDLAAIPVDRKIGEPKRVRRLKLRVEGVEGTEFDVTVLNSGRQRFRDGILEISREQMPTKPPFLLPKKDWSPTIAPYLEAEYNVQSDDRVIMEQAEEVVGGGRDPRVAATRLMAWVHRSVEKKPVISVPSALEVLETRMGDCNEHSVLLNALMRGAGIPSRTCVGVVYARGRFLYHAWNECYLGEWVTMDSTLNQMPTDATHVKLAQGGLDRQTEMVALMGNLKLEVLDYEYD
jgi:hypothetical protein